MGSNLNLNYQIEEYINSHSIKLHPVQYEIIKYNETLGEIKKMQISISQCHFLHLIVKIINPKKIGLLPPAPLPGINRLIVF